MTLRVIIAEMNRIASHLVGMGAYGLDLGSFSPFLYAFREREIILDLFEEACGARLTYSYLTLGGATHDLPTSIQIPPGLAALTGKKMDLKLSWVDACLLFLDWLEKRIPEYHTLLTENQIFIKRTAGLGILSREMAIDYGCTGPVLRGSGVNHDLRHRRRAHLHPDVRRLSIRGSRRCRSRSASGGRARRQLVPVLCADARGSRIDPIGAAGNRALCQGGGDIPRAFQNGHEASQSRCVSRNRMPARPDGILHCRQRQARTVPCSREEFVLLQSLRDGELCAGCLIADIPAIVGSLDVVMGEIDR